MQTQIYIVQYVIQIKAEIIKHVNQSECKNYRTCKGDYNWKPSKCTCENSKYLKSITSISIDTSVTECDEIIVVMDNRVQINIL